MEKIGEGSQSVVYKLDNEWVFTHYKLSSEHPIDFNTIEILINKAQNLHRVIIPVKADYDISGTKIVGTYSRYVLGQNINEMDKFELYNIPCKCFYKWYCEFLEDVIYLGKLNILTTDISRDNMLLGNDGPYLVDIGCFKFDNSKSIEEIVKKNIEELNFCFLYGIIWKAGQFVTNQSFQEVFNEMNNFDGTLLDYLKFKNPYDYKNVNGKKIS